MTIRPTKRWLEKFLAAVPPNPIWSANNLRRHHRKRTTGKDAGCFEDLLGIPGIMTEAQYEQRSERAVHRCARQFVDQRFDPRRIQSDAMVVRPMRFH